MKNEKNIYNFFIRVENDLGTYSALSHTLQTSDSGRYHSGD
jgi:hypothetical protein